MNKKEIISKVLSEDNISSFKESDKLEAMIDNELSKPDPDCELVYELTLNALESKGKKPLCNDANEKLEELKAIQNREKKHFHMPKLLTGLAAACIMLVFTNVISVSAWNITIDDFMSDTVGIPSDHHNISEREICGHTAIISKEDNQMIVAFRSGEFNIVVFTENLDYTECDKFLDFIK